MKDEIKPLVHRRDESFREKMHQRKDCLLILRSYFLPNNGLGFIFSYNRNFGIFGLHVYLRNYFVVSPTFFPKEALLRLSNVAVTFFFFLVFKCINGKVIKISPVAQPSLKKSLLNRDYCFHSSFQRRNVCFHIQQATFYVSESEKRSCPTQLNSVSKKHFLLLEGRRLGFRQGRWPGCAGPRGQVWCILPAPPVRGVCREMCGLEPFHNRRVPGAWTCFCSE